MLLTSAGLQYNLSHLMNLNVKIYYNPRIMSKPWQINDCRSTKFKNINYKKNKIYRGDLKQSFNFSRVLRFSE
jgi:hypothetical protein